MNQYNNTQFGSRGLPEKTRFYLAGHLMIIFTLVVHLKREFLVLIKTRERQNNAQYRISFSYGVPPPYPTPLSNNLPLQLEAL